LRVLPPGEFFGYLGQFRNTRGIPIRPAAIKHPVETEPAPRLTVLTHGLEHDIHRLAGVGVEAVAAPVATLRRLARGIESGSLPPATFTHSVIAFTDFDQGGVAEGDRALFWRAFQVPVFEQYLGLDGSLLAGECEAHNGVHVEPGNAIWESIHSELVVTSLTDRQYPTLRLGTDWTGDLVLDPCDCGSETPRLLNMVRLEAPLAAAAGA
jgi:phenylacetate-CoA ligase